MYINWVCQNLVCAWGYRIYTTLGCKSQGAKWTLEYGVPCMNTPYMFVKSSTWNKLPEKQKKNHKNNFHFSWKRNSVLSQVYDIKKYTYLSQVAHLKGFSPVCLRLWAFKWAIFLKAAGQDAHLWFLSKSSLLKLRNTFNSLFFLPILMNNSYHKFILPCRLVNCSVSSRGLQISLCCHN